MSNISSFYERHAVYGGIILEVAEYSLDKVETLLAGIDRGVYRAVGSALSRAAAAGKTAAKSAVTKEYTISQGEFLQRTKNINHFVHESYGSLSVVFGFYGYVIPLIQFNTKVGKDGRIVAQVKRSGAAQTLDRAFVAQMGGHRGIYERVGVKKRPVKELYGPATPQMMYANEAVIDNVEAKMIDTYEKRIDHEIIRVLNGWGG